MCNNDKESVFRDKFNTLCTPEYNEDINWSSSSSSDYENVQTKSKHCNLNKSNYRKRKRKTKTPKNISNLDVTIIDISGSGSCKSPILIRKKEENTSINSSPVLHSQIKSKAKETSQAPFLHGLDTSPLLTQKVFKSDSAEKSKKKLFENVSKPLESKIEKSPIISSKIFQRKVHHKPTSLSFGANHNESSKKTLMYNKIKSDDLKMNVILDQSRKIILDHKNFPHRENNVNEVIFNIEKTHFEDSKHQKAENFNSSEVPFLENTIKSLKKSVKLHQSRKNIFEYEEFPDQDNDVNAAIIKMEPKHFEETKHQIAEKIKIESDTAAYNDIPKKYKSYFESQFSSRSPSQHSISDIQTPHNTEEKSDSDIVIVQSLTQHPSTVSSNIINSVSTKTSLESDEVILGKTKKVKYKKDSLAFRLHHLIKKQTASIALWKHEQFLAENSKFVLPKGEFISFRIQKVEFQFGCYLLETMDFNNECFTILINSTYVNDVSLKSDCVIKVYKPYTVLGSIFDKRIVLNVCKFQLSPLKSL